MSEYNVSEERRDDIDGMTTSQLILMVEMDEVARKLTIGEIHFILEIAAEREDSLSHQLLATVGRRC